MKGRKLKILWDVILSAILCLITYMYVIRIYFSEGLTELGKAHEYLYYAPGLMVIVPLFSIFWFNVNKYFRIILVIPYVLALILLCRYYKYEMEWMGSHCFLSVFLGDCVIPMSVGLFLSVIVLVKGYGWPEMIMRVVKKQHDIKAVIAWIVVVNNVSDV